MYVPSLDYEGRGLSVIDLNFFPAQEPVSAPAHWYGKYWRTQWMTLDNVTRLPWPERVMVNRDRLILTFSAPIDGGSIPAVGAFTVKVGGSAVDLASANPVSVSGRTVTLALAAAVAAGDTVTVSYAKPAGSPLQNVVCEDAPSFTDRSATNLTGVAP